MPWVRGGVDASAETSTRVIPIVSQTEISVSMPAVLADWKLVSRDRGFNQPSFPHIALVARTPGPTYSQYDTPDYATQTGTTRLISNIERALSCLISWSTGVGECIALFLASPEGGD